MPTQLSTLYRFFRHEDQAGSNPVWNVASVPFDAKFRMYRIYYSDSENVHLNCDMEDVMQITGKWRNNVQSILRVILTILENKAYSSEFREACLQIMKEDPWLEEYMKDVSSVLTETLRLPCK